MGQSYADIARERDELKSENEMLRSIMDKMLDKGKRLEEENKQLRKRPEIVYAEMTERLKAEVAIEKRMTAKKIISYLGTLKEDDGTPFKAYFWYKVLCKKYDVEVE